jgi:hypothetical protein
VRLAALQGAARSVDEQPGVSPAKVQPASAKKPADTSALPKGRGSISLAGPALDRAYATKRDQQRPGTRLGKKAARALALAADSRSGSRKQRRAGARSQGSDAPPAKEASDGTRKPAIREDPAAAMVGNVPVTLRHPVAEVAVEDHEPPGRPSPSAEARDRGPMGSIDVRAHTVVRIGIGASRLESPPQFQGRLDRDAATCGMPPTGSRETPTLNATDFPAIQHPGSPPFGIPRQKSTVVPSGQSPPAPGQDVDPAGDRLPIAGPRAAFAPSVPSESQPIQGFAAPVIVDFPVSRPAPNPVDESAIHFRGALEAGASHGIDFNGRIGRHPLQSSQSPADHNQTPFAEAQVRRAIAPQHVQPVSHATGAPRRIPQAVRAPQARAPLPFAPVTEAPGRPEASVPPRSSLRAETVSGGRKNNGLAGTRRDPTSPEPLGAARPLNTVLSRGEPVEVRRQRGASRDADGASAVRVHIGRIRIDSAPPPAIRRRPTRPRPSLSLDQYLYRRSGGS